MARVQDLTVFARINLLLFIKFNNARASHLWDSRLQKQKGLTHDDMNFVLMYFTFVDLLSYIAYVIIIDLFHFYLYLYFTLETASARNNMQSGKRMKQYQQGCLQSYKLCFIFRLITNYFIFSFLHSCLMRLEAR